MENVNPFDDEQQTCYILCNDQQLYSLWPDFCLIPAGWLAVFGPASREQCMTWLQQHWWDRQRLPQADQRLTNNRSERGG